MLCICVCIKSIKELKFVVVLYKINEIATILKHMQKTIFTYEQLPKMKGIGPVFKQLVHCFKSIWTQVLKS